jgi:hypothetical protein
MVTTSHASHITNAPIRTLSAAFSSTKMFVHYPSANRIEEDAQQFFATSVAAYAPVQSLSVPATSMVQTAMPNWPQRQPRNLPALRLVFSQPLFASIRMVMAVSTKSLVDDGSNYFLPPAGKHDSANTSRSSQLDEAR